MQRGVKQLIVQTIIVFFMLVIISPIITGLVNTVVTTTQPMMPSGYLVTTYIMPIYTTVTTTYVPYVEYSFLSLIFAIIGSLIYAFVFSLRMRNNDTMENYGSFDTSIFDRW